MHLGVFCEMARFAFRRPEAYVDPLPEIDSYRDRDAAVYDIRFNPYFDALVDHDGKLHRPWDEAA